MAVAMRSHLVLSRDELLAMVSKNTITNWLRSGLVVRIAPRVYGFSTEPEWRSEIHAAALSLPGAVVSHRSAARLWEIAPSPVRHVEVIQSPGARSRSSKIRVHHSSYLPRAHVHHAQGTPVTSPARTIVDLSAVYGIERTHRAISKALDLNLLTVEEVRRMREEMARKGRRRTKRIIDVVLSDERYADSYTQSALEREAVKRIARAGLPAPVAQMAVPLARFTLHPDLAYPEWGLAIELDGWKTHGTRSAFHDDRERDALLAIEGWHVVRFSWETIDLLPRTIRSFMSRKLAS
jgi:hypothetical protein